MAPGNIEMFSDLGIMYLKVNEIDRAYEKLQEAIQIEKHTGCLLALGAIMQTKNDVDGALNHYKNIQNMQDESFEVWSNLGMCFYKKNKLIAVNYIHDVQMHKVHLFYTFLSYILFIPFAVYIMFEKVIVAITIELQCTLQHGNSINDSKTVCKFISMFCISCKSSS